MKSGINFFNSSMEQAILSIRTAYLGKVLSINGGSALIQPLTMYRAIGGGAEKASPVNAVIPKNIKYKTEEITYMKTINMQETKTVLIPAELAVGDIVYVGICDRDISNAKNGVIATATNRHHDINDGVILKVL